MMDGRLARRESDSAIPESFVSYYERRLLEHRPDTMPSSRAPKGPIATSPGNAV